MNLELLCAFVAVCELEVVAAVFELEVVVAVFELVELNNCCCDDFVNQVLYQIRTRLQ